MTKHKDIYFQDAEGTIAATKDGDKVALALNNPPSFLNKLRFYTIVFSYGNEYDEHTTSIVLPLSEIPELIKSLTALLDSE